MADDERRALNAVADRMGALYQKIGEAGHRHGFDDTDLLDEALAITREIEKITGRSSDEAH